MTLEIMRYDMTVDNEKYPQYFYHENAVLSPLEGTDQDYIKTPDGILGAAIRFLNSFIRLLTKLLAGKFSLGLSGILG